MCDDIKVFIQWHFRGEEKHALCEGDEVFIPRGNWILIISSFSHSVLSNSLQSHGLQHTRLPCPSLSPEFCWKSYPLSRWCNPTTSSSVTHFSSCPQSFPASGSFQISQFFTSAGQSIRVSASASVLPMNILGWFPLGLTGLIYLLSKGLSRVFSSTTIQRHQFFCA